MATNVLVIPEDFRKDQYVLKPIIEKMFVELDVKARVQVCRDPLLGGVGEALKWERLEEILERYKGMTRVFLLVVDRDCEVRRKDKLKALESRAAKFLTGTKCVFLAEAAHQEVEVWVLAGLDLPKEWVWKDLRAHCDPKEAYYDVLAKERGLFDLPYEGRDHLAKEAARNYKNRIRTLCKEDVGELEERVSKALKTDT